MSALSGDEFDAINHALSHANVFHGNEFFQARIAIEGSLLAVAQGNLIDPATVAAEALRSSYAAALEICTCTDEDALR